MPILTVHLEKITNLADGDHIGKSDPYVKVCIVLCCFVPWAAGRDQEFFRFGNCSVAIALIAPRQFCGSFHWRACWRGRKSETRPPKFPRVCLKRF